MQFWFLWMQFCVFCVLMTGQWFFFPFPDYIVGKSGKLPATLKGAFSCELPALRPDGNWGSALPPTLASLSAERSDSRQTHPVELAHGFLVHQPRRVEVLGGFMDRCHNLATIPIRLCHRISPRPLPNLRPHTHRLRNSSQRPVDRPDQGSRHCEARGDQMRVGEADTFTPKAACFDHGPHIG